MSKKIKMQVTLSFMAEVDESLSVDGIMERVKINAVGDGELVEVYGTEITDIDSFFTIKNEN